MITTYEYAGETITVSIEHNGDGTITARVGDASYTLRAAPAAHDGLLLDFGDRRTVAHAAKDGDARFVHVDGQTYTLERVDGKSRRRRTAAAAGDLTAQMPGQVVDVLVADGDAVSAGQTLVILEAMKMEIRASAPVEGRVKQVLVSKGDVVDRGQLLVVLDTD